MQVKAGDTIRYTSSAGVLTALVESITIGPTAKPGHSIAWLNITTHVTPTRRYESSFSIPADAASLKMFKIEVL